MFIKIFFLIIITSCSTLPKNEYPTIEPVCPKTKAPIINAEIENTLMKVKTSPTYDMEFKRDIEFLLHPNTPSKVKEETFQRIIEVIQIAKLSERDRQYYAKIIFERSPSFYQKSFAFQILLKHLENRQLSKNDKESLQDFLLQYAKNDLEKMRILGTFKKSSQKALRNHILILRAQPTQNTESQTMAIPKPITKTNQNIPKTFTNNSEKKEPLTFENYKKFLKTQNQEIQPVEIDLEKFD